MKNKIHKPRWGKNFFWGGKDFTACGILVSSELLKNQWKKVTCLKCLKYKKR